MYGWILEIKLRRDPTCHDIPKMAKWIEDNFKQFVRLTPRIRKKGARYYSTLRRLLIYSIDDYDERKILEFFRIFSDIVEFIRVYEVKEIGEVLIDVRRV